MLFEKFRSLLLCRRRKSQKRFRQRSRNNECQRTTVQPLRTINIFAILLTSKLTGHHSLGQLCIDLLVGPAIDRLVDVPKDLHIFEQVLVHNVDATSRNRIRFDEFGLFRLDRNDISRIEPDAFPFPGIGKEFHNGISGQLMRISKNLEELLLLLCR